MADTANQETIWGLGRRKSAVARVRIKAGTGVMTINKRPSDEFFCNANDRNALQKPFKVTDLEGKFDVNVNVNGGGTTAQSEAVRLGISRALVKTNKELEVRLKEFGLLTRDPRMKERKKPGLRGARKGTQFSKR